MKNARFLIKLKKEGKINLIAPSEEVKESYLKDSESYFISSKMLFKEIRLKESTQFIYFSVYYSILALLFRTGIKSENHLASIILLKEIFSLDNSFVLIQTLILFRRATEKDLHEIFPNGRKFYINRFLQDVESKRAHIPMAPEDSEHNR